MRVWTPLTTSPHYIIQRSSQKQRTWKTVDSFAADQETIGAIFRIVVSANQPSLYGAVANMCDEHESLHDRSGQPEVMGQSIVFSEIKTEVLVEDDDPASQNFQLQQYEERIERLSQQDKVSGKGDGVPKACTQQGAADSRRPRICVCANTFFVGGGIRGEEG